MPGTDPVHKVTIIPRGPALGLTQQLPSEDRYGASRDYLLKDIAILLGGRIAEELVRGEITTGASNDIERATDIAHKMVCEWGMSDKLGPLSFGQKEEEIFLGREISRTQNYSPQTAIQIDEEVKAIVMRQYEVAKALLSQNREALDRITAALLEFETIDSADIDTLMQGGTIQRAKSEPPKPVTPPREEDEAQEKQKIIDALDGLIAEPSKAAG